MRGDLHCPTEDKSETTYEPDGNTISERMGALGQNETCQKRRRPLRMYEDVIEAGVLLDPYNASYLKNGSTVAACTSPVYTAIIKDVKTHPRAQNRPRRW